jgi:hypothetical protein
MNGTERIAFYAEALQVRDIGSDELDMVMEVEDLDMKTATVEACKQAIIKWQYIDDRTPWVWSTRLPELLEALRAKQRDTLL